MQSNLYEKKPGPLTPSRPHVSGPITRNKQMRSYLIYFVVYLVALLFILGPSLSLRQFGFGLMVPGGAGLANFIESPNWMTGGMVIGGVGITALGLMIWFATGNVFAPFVGWLLSAIWGATMEPATSNAASTIVTLTPLLLIGSGLIANGYKNVAAAKGPDMRDDACKSASSSIEPLEDHRQEDALSDEDLARLRLLLDRALQPIEEFNGFEKLDQFQTAALRYQINFISYALSMVQAEFMPAFKGYMHTAQDNLTAKQQDRRIWGYWKLENMWGNLRSSGDPIAKDNIMYSGFVAAQLMYRIKSTSYPNDARKVTLRCRADDTTCYDYTLPQIIEQLVTQYEDAEFGLLPCEPNWVYPLCNAITATAIRAFDAQNGTSHWDGISARFQHALETEFTNSKGQFVPFRSSYTGFAPSSIGGAVMQGFPCLFLNPLFPEIAQRHWSKTKNDRGTKSWRSVIWPIDVGNYGLSRAAGYAATAAAAKEMSDKEAADDLLAHLDDEVPSSTMNEITHRPKASLWAHANEVFARATNKGALSRLVTAPPKRHTPYLKSANYPDVLVAKAVGRPTGLCIVLVPGNGPTKVQIVVAGLDPSTEYAAQGIPNGPYQADSNGQMTLAFDLNRRLSIKISKMKKDS